MRFPHALLVSKAAWPVLARSRASAAEPSRASAQSQSHYSAYSAWGQAGERYRADRRRTIRVFGALEAAKPRCASAHARNIGDAAGESRLNDRKQPFFPQIKAMALFVLIGVQIIDLMKAWLGVRDDEFADEILDGKRRKMRPHRPA
jgi:hypothetical protein